MEKKKLKLTAQARRDLDRIYDYIAEAGDAESARKFISKLSIHIERIAFLGHSGVSRESLRPGLRMSVVGRYNIYFRVLEDDTIIVRVVNSARDIHGMKFSNERTK